MSALAAMYSSPLMTPLPLFDYYEFPLIDSIVHI